MKEIVKNINFNKVAILLLRGLGILSKFLLTFLITKRISLDFQGVYSLISTTVTLLVLFFGFDFYIYSNKYVIRNPSKAVFSLKNNLVFSAVVYVIFIPTLYFVFLHILRDVSFNLCLLLGIVILEHIGQEFFRMYVALQKVYLANILLFTRTGLWSILVVIYLFLHNRVEITINQLLSVWAISALLTVLLSFYFYPGIKSFFNEKIDRVWIRKGLKIALQMFLATIFLKVVEFSDRYIIDFYYDKEAVGIYTFYYQLANLSNIIIYTLYISFLFPGLIEAVSKNDHDTAESIRSTIKRKTLIIVFALSVIYALILPYFLPFIGRQQLYEYQLLLFCLLASGLFLNLSYASHYTLIGQNREGKILKITFICFLISFTFNIVLIKLIGIWGAAVSQFCAALCMFILKRREITSKRDYVL